MYAHRRDAPAHAAYRQWLTGALAAGGALGAPGAVWAGLIRVVTHPRIYAPPSTLAEALDFANALRAEPNWLVVEPGHRHWEIFTTLCRATGARGGLVWDAYLAAIAIELGAEWISADRDFARFPGLRWRHPLDP